MRAAFRGIIHGQVSAFLIRLVETQPASRWLLKQVLAYVGSNLDTLIAQRFEPPAVVGSVVPPRQDAVPVVNPLDITGGSLSCILHSAKANGLSATLS